MRDADVRTAGVDMCHLREASLVEMFPVVHDRVHDCHRPTFLANIAEVVEAAQSVPHGGVIEVAEGERAHDVGIHRVLEVHPYHRLVNHTRLGELHDNRLVVVLSLRPKSDNTSHIKHALNLLGGNKLLAWQTQLARRAIPCRLTETNLLAVHRARDVRSRKRQTGLDWETVFVRCYLFGV